MKRPVKVTIDGVEKKYFVSKPTAKQEAFAKLESNKAFRAAINGDSFFREELTTKLIERGIWSDKEEEQLQTYQNKIRENLEKLDEGGIELLEAKKLALEIRHNRMALMILSAKLREHDKYTIEAQCDNAFFDALVALCSLDEEGKQVFKSYDDYLEKSTEEYARLLAGELSRIMFDFNDDWEKELPENKFLLEYKFVDEDLNFINEEGKRVDAEGRLIDDKGRYIDGEGNFITKDGERVDENGKKLREKKPFLVNGNPVK